MKVSRLLGASDDGKLPSSLMEGIPLLYMTEEGCILCPDCANDRLEKAPPRLWPEEAFTYHQGAPQTCDQCGRDIESAEGEQP